MTETNLLEPMTYENDFREFLAKRDAGECCLIDEEMFDYFLEVLPPVLMMREVELIDGNKRRVSFGFAEGAERVTAFWQENGHFFAQHTTMIARGW